MGIREGFSVVLCLETPMKSGGSPSWKRRGLLYPDSGCSAPAMTTVMVMASSKSPRTISANGNQNHFSQ